MLHVVLTGFMASGKTAVGRRLARRLGFDFVDTDQAIEESTGASVSEIFAREGEPGFRRLERETIERLALERPTVIATGGGTFVDAENRATLHRLGPVVCLVTSPDVVLERVSRSDKRPLASGPDAAERLSKLYESRLPFYRMADVMVETDGLTVDAAAARVAAAIAPRLRSAVKSDCKNDVRGDARNDPNSHGRSEVKLESRSDEKFDTTPRRHLSTARSDSPQQEAAVPRATVHVDLAERSYDCTVGSGAIDDAGRVLAAMKPTRVFLVTNEIVAPLYARRIEDALAAADARLAAEMVTIELRDGERFKTMQSIETIYDRALDAGIDRKAVFVALGGGVAGDLTAFAASTILRGVRFVMIPTTLLAQVDSSVGGKTGMDRPQGKNLVGTFWQPSAVLIDPATLATLPERELRAGLAEVVKTAAILDAGLFERLERDAGALLARSPDVLTDVIARCVRIKADVVEQDEREEKGLRRVLNFGHTVAHAIEQVTGYERFLHGEAVAIGMGVAARISEKRGLCASSDARRIETLLRRLGLEHEVPAGLDKAALTKAIALDKKAERDRVAYIVCEAIGRCRAETLEVLLSFPQGVHQRRRVGIT